MPTPARDAPREPRRRAPAVGAVLAIVILGLGVPLLLAAHYHALGIPRSDDWSYLVTEFRWIDGGRLSFNHWVSMSLVGQLVLAAPLAAMVPRSVGALQVLTAVLGTTGLAAVWLGARFAGIGRERALLLALTIAAGPLWAPLAMSFMTDVPTFAACAVALALALAGITRRPVSIGLVRASVATAAFACMIRQYAIVTLVAVLVASWIAAGQDRRARRATVNAGAIAFATLAVFFVWWRTVPDGRSLSPGVPDLHALSVFASKGAGMLRLSGLLLLPVLLAVRPVTRLRAAWRSERTLTLLVVSGCAVWVAATTVRAAADLFVGNYVVHDGVLSDIVLVGHRPDVLPAPLWAAVVAIASIAGVALAVLAADAAARGLRALVRRPRPAPDPVTVVLAVSVLGYLGGYCLAILTGIQVYDRYLLPVLPVAGMLLLRAPLPAPTKTTDDAHHAPGGVGVAAVVALIGVAALGLAFGADSASFDGARWRAAEAAVARGWPAREVNGGFEWRNFHRGDSVPRGRARQRICVTVHVNPREAPRRVVAVVESDAPTRGSARLVAYRTNTPCPPPRP